MKNLIFISSAFISLLAVSCKKTNELAPATTAVIVTKSSVAHSSDHTPTTTLYFSGVDGATAVYWQNGVKHNLPVTATNNNNSANVTSYTYNMAASDTDIYITGYNGRNYVYWKNSVSNAVPIYATSIVLSGTDAYFAGSYGVSNAEYLQNGIVHALPVNGAQAYVWAMAVSGTDVYLAGNNNYKAAYWKNGVEYTLTSSPDHSAVVAMAISGTDVYFAGMDDNKPVYWKNGVEYVLPMTGSSGSVTAMAISGTDIYFAGTDFRNAVYWKNGVETFLPTSSGSISYSIVSSIAIDGTDVYIAGGEGTIDASGANSYGIAEYWKNGAVHSLPIASAIGGYTTGMAIVRK